MRGSEWEGGKGHAGRGSAGRVACVLPSCMPAGAALAVVARRTQQANHPPGTAPAAERVGSLLWHTFSGWRWSDCWNGGCLLWCRKRLVVL